MLIVVSRLFFRLCSDNYARLVPFSVRVCLRRRVSTAMPDVPPEEPKMKVSGKKHSKSSSTCMPYHLISEDDKGMKSLPPLLQAGEVLRNRYAVEAMIGGGGFGQIFR